MKPNVAKAQDLFVKVLEVLVEHTRANGRTSAATAEALAATEAAFRWFHAVACTGGPTPCPITEASPMVDLVIQDARDHIAAFAQLIQDGPLH